jgi:hypothetical protein
VTSLVLTLRAHRTRFVGGAAAPASGYGLRGGRTVADNAGTAGARA